MNNEQNNQTIIECRYSWTKESNGEESNSVELNHWRTEWMNNHRRMKQYTIDAQYTIIRDRPTNEAQGELKRTSCMKSKGRLPGSNPLRSDGSQILRWRGWTTWGVAKENSRGAIRLMSTQINWFSWWSGSEARPGDWRPKTLKTKFNSRELPGSSQFRLDGSCDGQTGGWTLLMVKSSQGKSSLYFSAANVDSTMMVASKQSE